MGNRHAPITRWQSPWVMYVTRFARTTTDGIRIGWQIYQQANLFNPNSRETLRTKRRVFAYCQSLSLSSYKLERHADTIDVSSAASDTNIRDVTTANRYVRRSSEKVSYKTKAVEIPAKTCEKKNQASRAQVFDEEGREWDPSVEEGEFVLRNARTRTCVRACACMYVGKLKRGSKVSVPKGSGGRSDGRTVIVIVEQRGITWGYMSWGPGPGGPRVAKAKVCRVYKTRNRRQSASSSLLDAPGTSRQQKWESWYVLRHSRFACNIFRLSVALSESEKRRWNVYRGSSDR